MLREQIIRRECRRYSEQNPKLADALGHFADLYTHLAQLAADEPAYPDELDEKTLLAAEAGNCILLRESTITLSGEHFAQTAAKIAPHFTDEPFDWFSIATDALLSLAVQSPEDYFDALADMEGIDEERLTHFVLPVASLTLRVMLNAWAESMSEQLMRIHGDDDTVHIQRPLLCPVCGSHPAIAVVAPTKNHGNVKVLHCDNCGGYWPFERIRCACCGESAVSAFDYVYAEGDENHRLHLCKTCQSAMPTVFCAGEQYSPELEIALTQDLQLAYDEDRTERDAATN